MGITVFLPHGGQADLTAAGISTQIQFNDGGVLAGDAGLTYSRATGQVSIGGGTPAGQLLVTSRDAARPAVRLKGAVSHSGNLLEVVDSSDALMMWVAFNGHTSTPVLYLNTLAEKTTLNNARIAMMASKAIMLNTDNADRLKIDANGIVAQNSTPFRGAYKASDGTAGGTATTGGLTFKDGLYLSGLSNAEPSLGNPDVDGKVLASLANGTRQWVTMSGGDVDLSAYYTQVNLQTAGQAQVAWGNLTGVPQTFTPSAHTLLGHTVNGLVTGQFLKATGASAFGFAAVTQADVTGLTTADNVQFASVRAAYKAADGTAGATKTIAGGAYKDGLFTGVASQSFKFAIPDPEVEDLCLFPVRVGVNIATVVVTAIGGTAEGQLLFFDVNAANPTTIDGANWALAAGKNTLAKAKALSAGEYIGWRTSVKGSGLTLLNVRIDYTE